MTVQELTERLVLSVCSGSEGLGREIKGGYTSDLLSDVMGHAKEGDVWVILQTHKNIMAIASLKDAEECKRFLQDLCTVSELKAMEQRMEVAMLLDQGLIYSEILERTGASSATISRVNRCLHYGANGYRTVIPRLKEDGEHGEL